MEPEEMPNDPSLIHLQVISLLNERNQLIESLSARIEYQTEWTKKTKHRMDDIERKMFLLATMLVILFILVLWGSQ